MMNWINKKRNKKGFTLVELVVVIAILGILAAIAVPRLTNLRHEATVKAEGATAVSIANAARIQETSTGKAVSTLTVTETPKEGELKAEYMTLPDNHGYTIEQNSTSGLYEISWATKAGGTFTAKPNFKYTEGTEFKTDSGVAGK